MLKVLSIRTYNLFDESPTRENDNIQDTKNVNK